MNTSSAESVSKSATELAGNPTRFPSEFIAQIARISMAKELPFPARGRAAVTLDRLCRTYRVPYSCGAALINVSQSKASRLCDIWRRFGPIYDDLLIVYNALREPHLRQLSRLENPHDATIVLRRALGPNLPTSRVITEAKLKQLLDELFNSGQLQKRPRVRRPSTGRLDRAIQEALTAARLWDKEHQVVLLLESALWVIALPDDAQKDSPGASVVHDSKDSSCDTSASEG